MVGVLIYSRNRSLNLLPWESTSNIGLIPLSRSPQNTFKISSILIMSRRILPPIDIFGFHQHIHSTSLPLYTRVGPPGYSLPGSDFFSKKLSSHVLPFTLIYTIHSIEYKDYTIYRQAFHFFETLSSIQLPVASVKPYFPKFQQKVGIVIEVGPHKTLVKLVLTCKIKKYHGKFLRELYR